MANVESPVVDLEPAQALQQIKDAIKGEIQLPDSEGYKTNMARAWNALGLHQPTAIVVAKDAQDVSIAIKFGVRAGLTIAPASGRHSNVWAGRSDGALVIDLSLLNEVRVNTEKRTAEVGGGSQLKDLDEECHKYKLHTTAGHNQSTGIGGFTTGGGFGYLARTHGMAIDLIESFEIVVASGDIVEASETSNPDLFWAVRGGGGNFGIVTRFTFKLYPVDRVWFCNAVWPWAKGEEIIEYTKEKNWAANLNEETSVAFMLMRDPQSGQPIVAGMFSVLGESDEQATQLAQSTFADFFEKFPPIFKSEESKEYLEVQRHLGDKGSAGSYLERGCMTKNECGELVSVIKEFVENWKIGYTFTGLLLGGGAIRRKQPTDAAWYQRDFTWWIISLAKIPDDIDEATLAHARELISTYGTKLDPFRLSEYLSIVDGSTAPTRSLSSYFGPNVDKLRQIKITWDPRNVFCHNRNILPEEK